MKRRIFLMLVISMLLSFGTGMAASQEEMALGSAKSWLKIVDDGDYAKSWEVAAAMFKKAVTVEQWKQAIATARGPLGKVVSRKVAVQKRHASLPGVPDGDYFIVQFSTEFAKKKSAMEVITLVKEKDQKWRLAGYFVN